VVNARLGHSWHPLANATLVGVLCADRRHQGCQCRDRRLRYVADFVQLSDKPLLVSTLLVGVSERKAQWQIEKLCADPIRVARSGLNNPNALCRTGCVVRAA